MVLDGGAGGGGDDDDDDGSLVAREFDNHKPPHNRVVPVMDVPSS